VLEPNAYDWGHPPPWRRVPIRVIGNDASREAALLSGDLVERDLLTLQAWSRAE
jgi:ABC-type transport system substrate-binding protein